MTGKADGTVYINSEIDTSGFKPGSKEIEAACRRAARSVKDIGDAARIALERQTAAFVKSNQLYARQEQKVKDLERQLEEMAEQKVATSVYTEIEKEISKLETALEKATQKQNKLTESGKANALTAEYIAASKQVDKLDNALLNAYNRKEKFLESGGSETSRTFKNIEYDIEKLESQLRQAIADKEELESSKTKETDVFIALQKEIDGIKQSLTEANAQKEKLESSGGAYQAVDTSAVEQKLIDAKERLLQMNDSLNVSYDALKSKVEQYGGSIAGTAQKHGLLRKALSSVASAAKRAGAAILTLHKNTKKSNGSVGTGIKNMLKYTLGISSLFVLIKKIKSAVKEGMQNLAQYSDETNTHLSALKSSITQLKNSLATAFNPILTVIEPILTRFINLLSQAATYVGMFFAALTGQTTFTKAVAVQEDYAASLGETADNAKEAKKYLSGLDEIRTYSEDKDTSGGGYQAPTPAEMFETVPIESKIKEFADKVKQTLSEMFTPLKESWDKYGEPIKEKLAEIKNRFVEFGEEIALSTKDWFSNLNWDPLLQSVDNLLGNLQPLIDLILDGLLWAWENVLEPFGKWTIEEAAPATIDLFSAVLGVLSEVLETLKPLGEWLWENFLQPIAEWAGDAFITGIETITDVLNKLSTKISEWRESGGMDDVISSLDSAKKWLVDIFTRINDGYEKYMKPVLEQLGQRFKEIMDGPVGETIEKVKGLIDKLSEAFQLLWNNVLDPLFKWIADNIMPILAPTVDFIGNTVITIIDTVIEVIGGIVDVLSGILDFIIGVFTKDWGRAWEGVKEIFTGIWEAIWGVIKGIVNLIIGLINGMISGVVTGINTMINALNKIKVDVPAIVTKFTGLESFRFNISTISAPQIPYLATGAVIPPNAPFMAVLGDQKHGTNIEAPLSLIEDSVNRAVRNAMGNQQQRNGTYIFEAQLDRRTIFRQVIKEAELHQTVTGRNPFELT